MKPIIKTSNGNIRPVPRKPSTEESPFFPISFRARARARGRKTTEAAGAKSARESSSDGARGEFARAWKVRGFRNQAIAARPEAACIEFSPRRQVWRSHDAARAELLDWVGTAARGVGARMYLAASLPFSGWQGSRRNSRFIRVLAPTPQTCNSIRSIRETK